MRLQELFEAQATGCLKATVRDNIQNEDKLVLTEEQCRSLLSKLGWLEYSKSPEEVLAKTDKFIHGLKPYIKNEEIIKNTEVTFQNRRKTNTLSYFDRIKMICGNKFNITVLRGMAGVGGVYGVYSDENNFRKPVYSCRSLKQLGEWINSRV